MTSFSQRFAGRRPLLWVEVSPPRGIKFDSLLDKLSALKGRVDAINLTDNAMAKVKMSALVLGGLVRQRLGIPVVLNVSCRDRNLLALKSDLLGAAALGIDAVVCLTGDKLSAGQHEEARTVRDVDAFGLLRVIGELNLGDTREGKRLLKTLPSLLPGAVANPSRENIEREYELLGRKADAGASFVITQPVFEPRKAIEFAARATSYNIETMLGILPVKRESMATYLKDKVKDLKAVHGHLDSYTGLSEREARDLSMKANLELMSSVWDKVAGFNVMSGGGPSLAIELALEFSKLRATRR